MEMRNCKICGAFNIYGYHKCPTIYECSEVDDDDEMKIEDMIEAVYAKERNAIISWIWDGGYDVSIGDDINGIKDTNSFPTFRKAVEWLYEQVVGEK